MGPYKSDRRMCFDVNLGQINKVVSFPKKNDAAAAVQCTPQLFSPKGEKKTPINLGFFLFFFPCTRIHVFNLKTSLSCHQP